MSLLPLFRPRLLRTPQNCTQHLLAKGTINSGAMKDPKPRAPSELSRPERPRLSSAGELSDGHIRPLSDPPLPPLWAVVHTAVSKSHAARDRRHAHLSNTTAQGRELAAGCDLHPRPTLPSLTVRLSHKLVTEPQFPHLSGWGEQWDLPCRGR